MSSPKLSEICSTPQFTFPSPEKNEKTADILEKMNSIVKKQLESETYKLGEFLTAEEIKEYKKKALEYVKKWKDVEHVKVFIKYGTTVVETELCEVKSLIDAQEEPIIEDIEEFMEQALCVVKGLPKALTDVLGKVQKPLIFNLVVKEKNGTYHYWLLDEVKYRDYTYTYDAWSVSRFF